MDRTTLIGIMAAICTTIAFFPQVARIWRTKHTNDLSLPMYVIFSFGVLCWCIYGILLRSWPVIVANGITFVLCAYILVMMVRYR